jgi:alpha-tubulin suppressor-like RCC1 family protein
MQFLRNNFRFSIALLAWVSICQLSIARLTAANFVVAWGSGPATNVPPELTNVVALSAGAYHDLALLGDKTVLAWGNNGYSQANVPTDLTDVSAVSAGFYHSVALREDGTVVVWGAGNRDQRLVPSGLSNAVAIAAGGFHTLALLKDGSVKNWGRY